MTEKNCRLPEQKFRYGVIKLKFRQGKNIRFLQITYQLTPPNTTHPCASINQWVSGITNAFIIIIINILYMLTCARFQSIHDIGTMV